MEQKPSISHVDIKGFCRWRTRVFDDSGVMVWSDYVLGLDDLPPPFPTRWNSKKWCNQNRKQIQPPIQFKSNLSQTGKKNTDKKKDKLQGTSPFLTFGPKQNNPQSVLGKRFVPSAQERESIIQIYNPQKVPWHLKNRPLENGDSYRENHPFLGFSRQFWGVVDVHSSKLT